VHNAIDETLPLSHWPNSQPLRQRAAVRNRPFRFCRRRNSSNAECLKHAQPAWGYGLRGRAICPPCTCCSSCSHCKIRRVNPGRNAIRCGNGDRSRTHATNLEKIRTVPTARDCGCTRWRRSGVVHPVVLGATRRHARVARSFEVRSSCRQCWVSSFGIPGWPDAAHGAPYDRNYRALLGDDRSSCLQAKLEATNL